jgi:hypothetical protein
MRNLKLIEDQPRWRVAVVAYFAKLMGVLVKVEGFPFGSARKLKPRRLETSLTATGAPTDA